FGSLSAGSVALPSLPSPYARRMPAPGNLRPHGRRRVAFLTNQLVGWRNRQPSQGGGERYAHELALLMRSLGLEVTFFQAADFAFETSCYGFPVVGLP